MMQTERDGDTGLGSEQRPGTAAPRWVKVFGIIAIVLVLLFAVLHLTGHSPGGHASHPSLTEHGARQP